MVRVANAHFLPHIIPICIMLQRRSSRGEEEVPIVVFVALFVSSELSSDYLRSNPEQVHQNKKRTKTTHPRTQTPSSDSRASLKPNTTMHTEIHRSLMETSMYMFYTPYRLLWLNIKTDCPATSAFFLDTQRSMHASTSNH